MVTAKITSVNRKTFYSIYYSTISLVIWKRKDLVEVRMSGIPLAFFMRVYTYFGLLSIEVRSNEFKCSRSFALFNVLQHLISFVSLLALNVAPSHVRSVVLESDPMSLKVFSAFAKIIFTISTLSIPVVSLFISQAQFWKRKEILQLMEDMSKLEMAESFSRKLTKMCKTHFYLFALFFTAMVMLETVGSFKHSLIGFVVGVTSVCPYLLLANFLSFLKTFEYFFIIHLQEFVHDLRTSIAKSSIDGQSFRELSKRYHKIMELNEKFNTTFGLQISLLTCSLTLMTTFAVNTFAFFINITKNNFFENISKFFQFVQSIVKFPNVAFVISSFFMSLAGYLYLYHLIASSGDKFEANRNKIVQMICQKGFANEFVSFLKLISK